MTVKLTKEQEKWLNFMIDEYGGKDHLMNKHCDGGTWKGGAQSLNELSAAKMARALYDGYEVEPEFKVGDWVHVSWYSNESGVYQVEEVYKNGSIRIDVENEIAITKLCPPLHMVRHATESEIAEEKERRFWAKLGRKTCEYRAGDIVEFEGRANVIEAVRGGGNVVVLEHEGTHFAHIRMICPAENRLDVNTNE